jgi:enediyne biosynthesis protein E4
MQRHKLFFIFSLCLGIFVLISACGKSDSPITPSLFTLTTGQQTGVQFENRVPDHAPNGLNIIQYLYYFNGGGVAAGYINGDTLPDLYFTSNLGSDALYINRGNLIFDSVALSYPLEASSKWTTGVTLADVNADGRTDIYVCQVGNYKACKGRNLLYINQGDDASGKPQFIEQAEAYGLGLNAFSTQAAFFDYDRDNDLDCFVLCHSVHSAGVYRDTSQTRNFDPLAADRLYRNEGNGHFTDVSASMGIYQGMAGYGLGLTIADLNIDGWPDIYIGNDFHESDYLYLNQRGKGFMECAQSAMGHTSQFTMGTDAADMNNDGRIDLLTLDMLPPDEYTRKASQPVDQLDVFEYKHHLGYQYQYPRNAFQINLGNTANGMPIFAEIGQFAGIEATDWSWSPLLADFDLDGHKDIFITNGVKRRGNNLDFLKFQASTEVQTKATDSEIANQMPEGRVPNVAFRNTGSTSFEDVSKAWGLDLNGFSNGSAYADLDADGDLDLIVNNLNASASIYQNTAQRKSRITIKLLGPKGNPHALGAKVMIDQKGGARHFELQATRGFQSCSEPIVICGLQGDAPDIEVLVEWPDGLWSYAAIDADHDVRLQFDYAVAVREKPIMRSTAKMADEVVLVQRDLPKAEFKKTEYTEKLKPFDSMAKGGRAKPSVLQPNLVLIHGIKPQVFDLQRNRSMIVQADGEVTASAFCDIDKDGKEEILIGLRNTTQGSWLALLRNQAGKWTQEKQFFMATDQIAVIAPSDFDGDGDQDVYIGCGAKTGSYGLTPQSHLLNNDGFGHFTPTDTRLLAGMDQCGMVRDAFWADMNADKSLDLVIAGEWMPILVYYQTAGQFRAFELPNTTGFWQCLYPADLDQDGDMDMLAGNLGENTRLRVSAKTPARLVVGDLDKNGQTEPIIGYYHRNIPYVLADRDLLATQMPGIKKQYPRYEAYAQARFDEVFPSPNLYPQLDRQTTVTASMSIINQGKTDNFTLKKLPEAVQRSSVHAICYAPKLKSYLLGGNLFDVQPYLGRQDASPVWLWRTDFFRETVRAWPEKLLAPREVRGVYVFDGVGWY